MNTTVLSKPESIEESTLCSRQQGRTAAARAKKRFPRLTIGADGTCCSILGKVAPAPTSTAQEATAAAQTVPAGSIN